MKLIFRFQNLVLSNDKKIILLYTRVPEIENEESENRGHLPTARTTQRILLIFGLNTYGRNISRGTEAILKFPS